MSNINIVKINGQYYKSKLTASESSINHVHNLESIDDTEALFILLNQTNERITELINRIDKLEERIDDIRDTLYPGGGFGVIE